MKLRGVRYWVLPAAMTICYIFDMKCNTTLHLLTRAKGTPHRKALNHHLIPSIHDEKWEHPRGMRGVRCCPMLVFITTGHDFVTKSHTIIHLLTSAKGASHENVLDDIIMQSKSKTKRQCSKWLPPVCYHPSLGVMQECHHIVVHCSCYSQFAGIYGYVSTTQIFNGIDDHIL
jgi:hypothetical protein